MFSSTAQVLQQCTSEPDSLNTVPRTLPQNYLEGKQSGLPVAATAIVPLCRQDLPGSGEQWSVWLHATERDGKLEVGKSWYRCSIRLLSQRLWRAALWMVVNIWLVTYWSYRKYFPGWSYKNRWEYTMMGKILIPLSSFISLKQREPMRKDCRSSLCHPAGSLAQVHNRVVEPYHSSFWSLWIKWSSSKDESIQRSVTRGRAEKRPQQVHESCLCLHGSMKRKSALSHWDT